MQTQIACPQCGTQYLAQIHQVIDVGQRPELKEQLLSGQLNVAVCPQCGAGGQLSTNMVYHDPAHELFMIYVPSELNLSQQQREEMIGRLTRQVMDGLPPEQRRAYLFQPQMMLTMQSFMEKVLETEGVTPEMIARQRGQAELLKTLVGADKDVVAHLIKERGSELDETFFAMLKAQVDVATQLNDNRRLIDLVNLQAKLMEETPVGRQLEKRRVALHALNRDAKKQEGLSPKLLLKHILLNQGDEAIIEQMAVAGAPAMTYEFYSALTAEIDKRERAGDRAGAMQLGSIRDKLLQTQEMMRQQSEQMLSRSSETLKILLQAPDKAAAVQDNLDKIDDAFMYVLQSAIAQAEEGGQQEETRALHEVYDLIVQQIEGQVPPEIRLLNQLIQTDSAREREALLNQEADLVTPELAEMVAKVIEQVMSSGQQQEMVSRLREVQALIQAAV